MLDNLCVLRTEADRRKLYSWSAFMCVDTNAFMRVSCECFVSAFANAFVDTFMCAHIFCRFYATRQ